MKQARSAVRRHLTTSITTSTSNQKGNLWLEEKQQWESQRVSEANKSDKMGDSLMHWWEGGIKFTPDS